LWTFNEESVARAIRASSVPVISAVGHEIDVTIADFAADLRAPTPSAAAELAVPDRRALSDALRAQVARLESALSGTLRRRLERVMLLGRSSAFREPLALVRRRGQDVDRLVDRLDQAAAARLERSRLRWEGLTGKLGALSPTAILARGYAIVRDAEGRVVRRFRDVAAGDPVHVKVGEGALDCRVERPFADREGASSRDG
ncbi:MAG: exodeoxyribonuclease VII large subunit, partial [bacterium]